ncbi:MAG: T9SS type A sorting domain-containing protein [Bacteroidetes bacterium]|nr:T9SS type A sorting domain-containing protein [Bacteroidota bacterium]
MNKIILFITFLLFTNVSYSQWSELGGTNALSANTYITSICSDLAGNIYAGGGFVNTNNKAYVAKWNGTVWTELAGLNGLSACYYINYVCSDAAGNIYATGQFMNANGNYYVAKWNGTVWTELGGTNSLAANNQIFSMCSDASGNIYAAGNFTNTNGKYYVAKWNGTVWSELGGINALAANFSISSICSDALGNIYAVGQFMNSNDNRYVAKWNGTTWSELGGVNSLSSYGYLATLCSDAAGNIYTAGILNASQRWSVIKWNGFVWSKLGGTNALSVIPPISTICSDAAGNIYAAGQFYNISGKYYVAKWDGLLWSELGGTNALSADAMICSICNDTSGNIYAAGYFHNSLWKCYVAKFKQCLFPKASLFTQAMPICSGANLSALPATSINGVTGTWSPAINNTQTTTYTFMADSGQCAIDTSMTIVVNPIPNAPTGSSLQTLITGSTIADLVVSGTAIKWYSTATGGVSLSSNTILVNGTHYYASQTLGSCESPNRLEVLVTINVGIEDFYFEKFSCFPNPVNNILSISNGFKINRIKLFNVLGQQVLEREINNIETKIDLTSVPKGTYIIEILTMQAIKRVKVIKD